MHRTAKLPHQSHAHLKPTTAAASDENDRPLAALLLSCVCVCGGGSVLGRAPVEGQQRACEERVRGQQPPHDVGSAGQCQLWAGGERAGKSHGALVTEQPGVEHAAAQPLRRFAAEAVTAGAVTVRVWGEDCTGKPAKRQSEPAVEGASGGGRSGGLKGGGGECCDVWPAAVYAGWYAGVAGVKGR